MCKLLLMTVSNIEDKNRIAHGLMLRQSTDQRDAWGISANLERVWKNSGEYFKAPLQWWKEEQNSNDIIIGHVRSASAATGKTAKEAHPFVFTLRGGERLIAVHNGAFGGTSFIKTETGEPNSDSYSAFKYLVQMLDDEFRTELTADIVTSWLNAFDSSTAFAIMVRIEDRVWVMRNEKRQLFYSQVGDGYIMATDRAALQNELVSLVDEPEIFVVEANRLFSTSLGNMEVSSEPFTLNQKAPATTGRVFSGTTYYGGSGWGQYTPPASSAKRYYDGYEDGEEGEVTYGESDSGSTPVVDTAPKNSFAFSAPPHVEPPSSKKAMQDCWSQIRYAANPLRQAELSLWFAIWTQAQKDNLGDDLVDENGALLFPVNWQVYTLEELQAFLEYVKGYNMSAAQRRTINLWNKTVPAESGVDFNAYYCGVNLYFTLPEETISQQLEAISEDTAF